MPILLGLCGSLRRNSNCSLILDTLSDMVSGRADFRRFRLNAVPFYNQDDDVDPALPEVLALRTTISEADAIVVSSPEYNGGPSAALLNAFDWASRPYGRCALAGKPVFIVTSSPGQTGGIRAHTQLTQTLGCIGARPLARPHAALGDIRRKIADGRLADQEALSFLDAAMTDLLAESAMLAVHRSMKIAS